MKFILFMIIGAGLLACSSYEKTFVAAQQLPISNKLSDPVIDSLVAPYRRSLVLEMNRVIGRAAEAMFPGRPNSLMGQWVADVLLQYGKDSLVPSSGQFPVIALLNTGGLRASFAGGAITVGDIYKLMPFDNTVVALKLPVEKLNAIRDFILTSGGEPIAGFKVIKGELKLDAQLPDPQFFWVITTDFLANGGDKMYFFQAAMDKQTTTLLLRDLLMREVAAKEVINVSLEERTQL